jgi:S-DNA-T family DNA segregation ATPase FtsK/SpoIIIE
MVLACLQDPRKEVVPSRGLFTQTIGLRLKDRSETTMVLGEGAAESGALCHQIPRSLPGVAYVSSEELSHPIRVRAFYADDNAIRATAQDYAAPQRLEVPALREPVDRRRLRTLEASE